MTPRMMLRVNAGLGSSDFRRRRPTSWKAELGLNELPADVLAPAPWR